MPSISDPEDRLARLESQLSTLAVLKAIYCLEDEFAVTQETADLLDAYEETGNTSTATTNTPLQATLQVSLSDEEEDALQKVIGLQIRFPAATIGNTIEQVQISLVRPDWLLRNAFDALHARFGQELLTIQSQHEEDDLAYIQGAAEIAKDMVHKLQLEQEDGQDLTRIPGDNTTVDSLVRIWMHLPSLSTKSKRDDLVTYAPNYSITGIVHAGKPALLVLEAPTVQDVESYLSDIKTYSWADIPSSHKKISERLREKDLKAEDRVFTDMQEITEIINTNGMKGVRSNRGDLGALRDWLTAKGLGGDCLSRVLGTNLNGS